MLIAMLANYNHVAGNMQFSARGTRFVQFPHRAPCTWRIPSIERSLIDVKRPSLSSRQHLREKYTANRESSTSAARISTIKLHKVTLRPVFSPHIPGSLSSRRRRSFYYPSRDSRRPRRVIIACEGRESPLSLGGRAFSRSVKLIARYYSHSTSRIVIRPDVSRITIVRCPECGKMREFTTKAQTRITL